MVVSIQCTVKLTGAVPIRHFSGIMSLICGNTNHKKPTTNPDLADSSHQPHSLLRVGQEDFGYDCHENSKDIVTGVTDSGDELRESRQELIRRQIFTVFTDDSVDFSQFLSHLSVYSTGCGDKYVQYKYINIDLYRFTFKN